MLSAKNTACSIHFTAAPCSVLYAIKDLSHGMMIWTYVCPAVTTSVSSLWEAKHPHGYLLQNKENTPNYRQTFSKLRKDHTTFLQKEDQAGIYHTGIFIDIFPLDRIPPQGLRRSIFSIVSKFFLLMTKEFPPSKASYIVRLGSATILRCIPKALRPHLRNACLHNIKKYNTQHHLELISTEGLSTLHTPLAANLFDSYTMLPFEDREYMCFSNWNDLLRSHYGDFMQLPPEKDRVWKHHPIIIDFEHNYEELDLSE